MIIITDEMLLNAFGAERVPYSKELVEPVIIGIIKKGGCGKDITEYNTYDEVTDPQSCWDEWLDSTKAKVEVADYYKNLSNGGMEDEYMNKSAGLKLKYETLLKKYVDLYKDFETFKEVTEGIATNGYYIKNEDLAELIDYKKKYECIKEEFKEYRDAAETIAIERNKLKDINEALRNQKDVIYKEKMDKIKQRDRQVTRLLAKCDEQHEIYLALVKERDNLAKRLEHINAISNTEWEFEEVKVEETKTTTPYDELVAFCENQEGSCIKCPNVIACDGINKNLRPARWSPEQREEYNELKNEENK